MLASKPGRQDFAVGRGPTGWSNRLAALPKPSWSNLGL
jgi:hypothetical protein